MESYSNRNYFDRKRSASPSYYDESKYNDYISDHDSRSPPDWQTKRDRDYDRNHDRREHSVERGTRDYKDYRDSGRDRSERTYSRDGYDRDRDYDHRSRKDRDSERGSRDRSGSREHDFSDSDSYRNKTTFSDSREGRREYDKDKDKRSVDWDRESNRSSRYNERGRSRERGRNDRDRSRSRRRSYDRDRDRDRRDRRRDDDRRRDGEHEEEMIDHTEGINYKNQAPNNTIMIRGLAQHITENDIRQDIMLSGLLPKDIRLIRKRDTGASRGFAFVEFATLQEATRWMEMKQGVLMLQDQYRAIMLYSIPKDQRANSSLSSSTDKTACKSDWICIKCGARNFRRRGNCYKCQTSRTESEVSLYATKTIMLRNLDALSTEDSVMSVLKVVVGSMVKYINGVLIGRDPLTQTSRGICYLDLESTVEALTLFGALNALNPPLTIDGKKVTVSYCKYRMGDLTQIFPQVALDNISTAQMYQMSDVNTLADYSASRYAKTPEQYHQYFEYYKNYFQQQVSQGVAISINQDSQINSTNAAAAVAQLAIKQRQGKLGIMTPMMSMMMVPPNGQDGKRYPLPDVSSYQYDETTGYYYDMSTGLYYDANSQYYYNSTIQKYLYWDSTKMTYLLAPTNETASTATAAAAVATVATVQQETTESTKPAEESEQQTSKKKTKGEKSDKAKVAKQIAKDMERWAKTMNKSKEALRPSTSNENSSGSNFASTAGSADIGFAVLEKKAAIAPNPTMMLPLAQSSSLEMRMLNSSQAQSSTLVAAYGSDDSGDDEPVIEGFPEGLDWDSRICLLCKRKFPSKEALAKHQKVSDLHRSNLEQIYAQRNINKGQTIKYRDRAKERREKFGEADSPPPSKLKEKYLKAREIVEPVISALPTAPIGENNLGNKLLQKMGWSEGQGLGKSNQGRTTIIETEKRVSNAGLGTKANAYTSQPGDTYKDCVKKMMYARYQELSNT